MRVLWYGETPFIETGAGQVAKHLLTLFQQFFQDIHLVAINQWWEQPGTPDNLKISVAPTEDVWNVDAARKAIAGGGYDVLFLTTDLNRITDLEPEIIGAKERGAIIIMYAAMDTHIWNPHFFHILELATLPVVFSHWCKRQALHLLPTLEKRLEVIYHGCEPDIFRPLPGEKAQIRAEMFGGDDRFMVLNVNRNQVRKDWARTFAAFKLFKDEHPDSFLYAHAKQIDQGGNLPAIAQAFGLRITGEKPDVIFAPADLHEAGGVSREDLNKIYNAADVFVTTSTGEGWGLTTTEAMAAGLPICAPNNTIFPELLDYKGLDSIGHWEGHNGLLVESGGKDLWMLLYNTTDSPREIVSTDGMARAISYVYKAPARAQYRAEAARRWTQKHTWDQVLEQWCGLFIPLGLQEIAS